jgi:phosphotransferase system HPr-like phosphotransfer protein
MKKRIVYLLVLAVTFSVTDIYAQLVSKNGQTGTATQIQGSRQNDIKAFETAKSILETAYRSGNKAKVLEERSKLITLATNEIGRSEKNLYDIKTGKLTHNPNTGAAFNKRLEIQTLTDRLNREKYLFNKLKDFNPEINMTNQRKLSGIRGNLSEFLNLMKTNLRKYDKIEPQAHGNSGTSSLKNHNNYGGGHMVHMVHNQPAKPAKNNLPPSYFRRMENRQLESFNKLRSNRNKKAASLSNDFKAFINKGMYDKAANILPEAAALVHSDIRSGKKFLERSGKFQYLKFDKTALESGIKKEEAIEQQLNELSKQGDIKSVENKVTKLLNDFRKIAVDIQ